MSEDIRIIVCLKQVPDPEVPASSFIIDSETRSITADGVPPVVNPYDESALELALKIKESRSEVYITALSMGPKLAKAVLMRALAVGADELYMIEGLPPDADGFITANVLAAAIRKMDFDLLLTGRQASDSNTGYVGLALAEQLNIPAVSRARKVHIDGEDLIIERVAPDGYEVLRGSLPALATVSHEAGQLRMPKLADMRKARQKPIYNMKVEDLEMDQLHGNTVSLTDLETPQLERVCNYMEADTPAEVGKKLVQTLFEDGILG